MATWFWLNIPLMLLFVCCWAGIPLWLMLTRWNAELSTRHAEIAATPGPAPVPARPALAVAHEADITAYAGVAELHDDQPRHGTCWAAANLSRIQRTHLVTVISG